MWVLNETFDQTIFIMKSSIHVDVEFHNTILIVCSVRIPTKYF